MQRIAVSRTDTSLPGLLAASLGYPLRGAALATCGVLAIVYLAGLLPSIIGGLIRIAYWVMLWRYGAACLLHSAHGYADPPDVGVEESTSVGVLLTVIHLVVVAAFTAGIVYDIPWLWMLSIVLALALPAIDMSLAFDGDFATALNPLTWFRTIASFGLRYLMPLALNLFTFMLVVLMAAGLNRLLPAILAAPIYGFVCAYLVFVNFQLMGAMVHQRHDDLGIEPESAGLVRANGQDADEQLVHRALVLSESDPAAALDLFVARLQNRAAPPAIHRAYRDLMRKRSMREGLLVHGQIWIAALVAGDETRRALGVVQECIELDPQFVPDDPATAGPLADAAARMGMKNVALQLARGFVRLWPRAPDAPRMGLLAARLMAEEPQRRAEAVVFLEKLARAWPGHPLVEEMEVLSRRLTATTS